MTKRQTVKFANILLIVAGFLTAVSSATAQNSAANAPGTTDSDWHFRYELFQMLLEQNGVQPTTDPQAALNDPRKSIIVLMGKLDGVLAPRTIERFCEQGGSILIATDTRYSAGRIGEFYSATTPVTSRRSSDFYQGHEDCIVVTDIAQHPLTEGVRSLVVNRTGWLAEPRWFRRSWDVSATLPGNLRPSSASRQPLIATVNMPTGGDGKMILAADPSLFTNGMLWHGDNALLAINVSRLLSEGDKSTMSFIVSGQFSASYQESPHVNSSMPPIPEDIPLPEPEAKTMLRIANSVIKRVEESNVFNEALANRPRNMPEPYFRRAVLFAFAVAALLFAVWVLISSGSAKRKPMPTRAMQSAHDLTSGQKVRAAEFGLSASLLAREFCRDVTGSATPAEWLRRLSTNAATGKSTIKSKDTQRELSTVLDLAVNTRTVHISRSRFEEIGRIIQKLKQLHHDEQLLTT